MVSGVILCGGTSRRMGSPKGLLTIAGKSFLRHLVEVLESARILDVAIVLGADADKIAPALDWFRGRIVINEQWQKGQIASINAGLEALDKADLHGAMICPVDHPLVTQQLLVRLLQEFWKSKKAIVIPVYKGRRGHPVIFRTSLFPELKQASPDLGAREVVHNHRDDVVEVETEEEGVVINIDTPADYRALVEREVS